MYKSKKIEFETVFDEKLIDYIWKNFILTATKTLFEIAICNITNWSN